MQPAGRPPLGFGKKSIDVSCAGLEVDIRAKVLDEQIKLIIVLCNEGLCIFCDLLDLSRRGCRPEDVLDQISRRCVEGRGRFPPFQRLDTFVKFALESIDSGGIEIFKPFKTKQASCRARPPAACR